MSQGRVKPSLHTLSRESFQPGEAKQFTTELLDASDRACAIIGAAYIERSLILLIQTRLRPLTKPESDALFFSHGATLKSFSERIEIAYALGLVSLKEKQALDAIRRIRNAFAHAIRPIDFENEHVAKACATLPHYDLTQKELKKLSPHRAKYIKCVVTIANYLAKTFGTDPRRAEISKLVTDPYAHEA
jgi:hypothetical protein